LIDALGTEENLPRVLRVAFVHLPKSRTECFLLLRQDDLAAADHHLEIADLIVDGALLLGELA
jgi:hypothetical protein